MNILVTGVTGNIGGKLVPRLLEAGHTVSCLARQPERLERYHWQEVTVHQGDLLDAASLTRSMQGVEVAYYLVHSMADGADGYEARDNQAALNFGRAAYAAGVKRIIYLGALGVCENDLTSHLASRQHVGELLRSCGVPLTEFRSAVIIGPGSMSFEMIRYVMERLPIILAPRAADTRSQPIALENVLDYLVQALSVPASAGRLYEIGGPDVLTYREMMLEYARMRGLKRRLVYIPWLNLHQAAFLMKLLTPIPYAYARPLMGGLRSEVVVHDPSAGQDFQVSLIPYPESLRRSLARDGNGEVESLWAGVPVRDSPRRMHRVTEGMFIEQFARDSQAAATDLYAVFSAIGGKRGWYFANALWKLRGWIDRLAGGVGMQRGRPAHDNLQPGDVLDGWRVEAVQPGRLLRLRNEMNAPGEAWMQFEALSLGNGKSRLILTSFFDPHGVMGLLYFWVLYPFHVYIFKGLSHHLVHRAEIACQEDLPLVLSQ